MKIGLLQTYNQITTYQVNSTTKKQYSTTANVRSPSLTGVLWTCPTPTCLNISVKITTNYLKLKSSSRAMMKLMNLDVTNATCASQLSILLICTILQVILVLTMRCITLLLQPFKSLLEATNDFFSLFISCSNYY